MKPKQHDVEKLTLSFGLESLNQSIQLIETLISYLFRVLLVAEKY